LAEKCKRAGKGGYFSFFLNKNTFNYIEIKTNTTLILLVCVYKKKSEKSFYLLNLENFSTETYEYKLNLKKLLNTV